MTTPRDPEFAVRLEGGGSHRAWTDRTVKGITAAFVTSHHTQLATLARQHYQADGRGLVVITVRGQVPTEPSLRAIQIGYRPLAEYRRLTTPLLQTPSAANVRHTIALIETYNPETHAAVLVSCGPTFLTFAFLMSLEVPVRLNTATGVH